MKKKLRRILILFIVFVLGVAGFSCFMNSQNTDNKTDLQTASIPCMAMEIGGMKVNRMYGYKNDMQEDFMRDTLTPLGTDKTLQVNITPYNQKIESLVYEIRTSDGSKVIENNKINHFEEQEDGKLLFHADYTDAENLLIWLLTFRDKVILLEPKKLRRELVDSINKMERRYKGE